MKFNWLGFERKYICFLMYLKGQNFGFLNFKNGNKLNLVYFS